MYLPHVLKHTVRAGAGHEGRLFIVQLQVLEGEGDGQGQVGHTLSKLLNCLGLESQLRECVATSERNKFVHILISLMLLYVWIERRISSAFVFNYSSNGAL